MSIFFFCSEFGNAFYVKVRLTEHQRIHTGDPLNAKNVGKPSAVKHTSPNTRELTQGGACLLLWRRLCRPPHHLMRPFGPSDHQGAQTEPVTVWLQHWCENMSSPPQRTARCIYCIWIFLISGEGEHFTLCWLALWVSLLCVDSSYPHAHCFLMGSLSFPSWFFNRDFMSLFLERGKGGRKRGRETSMCKRNIEWLPLAHTPNRDPAHNSDVCYEWELNQRPFTPGMTDDQPAESRWPGLTSLLKCYYSF